LKLKEAAIRKRLNIYLMYSFCHIFFQAEAHKENLRRQQTRMGQRARTIIEGATDGGDGRLRVGQYSLEVL
jgi:hypothetical protein